MLHQLKANQLKGLVRLGMVRRITEHMKVAPVIVALVAINMMYVFSALGSSNNAVFKYPAAPASPSALGVKRYTMRPVALCRGRSGADIGEYKMTANRLGYIPAPKLRPWLHSSDLATVRKACIAVLPPHLVVTHAHFTSGNRAFAVLAIPSDLLPSPSVLSGSVALDTLVVHKAEPMSSVLLFTAFNRACFHAPNVRKTGHGTRPSAIVGRYLVQGGLESALKPLGHELAFHWSAVHGQSRRLLAMRFGLPQPVSRSADVLSGGVQRKSIAAVVAFNNQKFKI